MKNDQLTDLDFCDAAELLDCDPAAIKAVATVESGRDGAFDDQGRLLIRFEGHKFRGYTARKYDQSHPHISYPYSQARRKKHGYTAFNAALELDASAALLSTSYGMFQPMGFNYEELGYATVDEMVDDMKKGARAQLMAFCRLILAWGLDDEMREASPAAFRRIARRYNGPSYKDNAYDEKMLRYYRKFRGTINCEPPDEAEAGPVTSQASPDPPITPSTVRPADTPTNDNSPNSAEQPKAEGRPVTDKISGGLQTVEQLSGQLGRIDKNVGGVSKTSWLTTIGTSLVGLWQLIRSAAADNPLVAAALVIAGTAAIGFAIWYLTRSKEREVVRERIVTDMFQRQ